MSVMYFGDYHHSVVGAIFVKYLSHYDLAPSTRPDQAAQESARANFDSYKERYSHIEEVSLLDFAFRFDKAAVEAVENMTPAQELKALNAVLYNSEEHLSKRFFMLAEKVKEALMYRHLPGDYEGADWGLEKPVRPRTATKRNLAA